MQQELDPRLRGDDDKYVFVILLLGKRPIGLD
jgi:hypothetical protein